MLCLLAIDYAGAIALLDDCPAPLLSRMHLFGPVHAQGADTYVR
jgi:hypothetical protein